MRLTSASVLWAPVASAVGFRAAVAAADAEARGTAYEHLRADPTSSSARSSRSSSSSSIQEDLPPKLSHHHEGDQQDVADAEKTTKDGVDLTDADADAEILLSDDAATRAVDAGVLPRAAPPGGGAGGALGTDDAHWSAVQPRKLKSAKETKASKKSQKAPKQAKGASGCAEGFCAQLGGAGFYGAGNCTTIPPLGSEAFLTVLVNLDANNDARDTSWVLKKRGDDEVISNCSLDSDQCQSPITFTGGATGAVLSTTVTVSPNRCYTVTMYSCSGEGLYGTGSWSVAFGFPTGTPTYGSNATFSAESITVGNCN